MVSNKKSPAYQINHRHLAYVDIYNVYLHGVVIEGCLFSGSIEVVERCYTRASLLQRCVNLFEGESSRVSNPSSRERRWIANPT